MNRRDIYLITGIILGTLAFSILFFKGMITNKGRENQIVVKVGAQEIKSLPLTQDHDTFWVQGKKGKLQIELQGEKVRVTHADCPDQLCVKQGAIFEPGKAIVCLPNEVTITIVGKKEAHQVDDISR
jgi:hypothetical protein